MSRMSLALSCSLVIVLAGCMVGSSSGDDVADDDDPATDGGAGGAPDAAPIDPVVHVPLDGSRPVEIMSPERLALVAARMPRVADPWLKGILESTDTMWYDRLSIVPGYQDSFGDNVIAPIGMRPNSIASTMIDTAVPGGHAQLFKSRGLFHFPFGRGIGDRADNLVVDFWHVPRKDGAILPVVWWRRDPNAYTHRTEWMFPRGTVTGEILFEVTADGTWFPFEIRVRVRELTGWTIDVFRPFPRAADLADALEARRTDEPSWATDPDITALIAHARAPDTLQPAQLRASHFASAFPTIDGARDVLPALADPSILQALLLEVPYRSTRGQVWKEQGALIAHAATTAASFHVVPRDYDGGFLAVDDDTCTTCHRDAGRPFKDWYDNVLAYGELWGNDEVFSWHPFENATFVNGNGDVVDFNYDNRTFRADFTPAGVLAPYQPSVHGGVDYQRLVESWTDFAY